MFKKLRSYVVEGQALLRKGNKEDAAKSIIQGLQHYSDSVLEALQPYAKADASLIVIVLRHIADEMERKNGCAEAVKGFEKIIIFPELKQMEKVRKKNKRNSKEP